MKFRNPETGEMYIGILNAMNHYCDSKKDCDDCQIKESVQVYKGQKHPCYAYVADNPHEAAQKYGIKPCTIRARIEHGWAPERAVSIRPGETVKLDDIIGGAQ